MTRTEDRLADALQASAAQVRDDRLRPLSEPGPEPGLRPARRSRIRSGRPPGAWRGWLAPVAAAVGVVLVIGLAVALAGAPARLGTRAPGGHGGPAPGQAAGIPRYFGQFAGTNPVGGSVEIRSTATGAVVASAPSPRAAGWSVQADAMAAAPDGRTFYVAYVAQHPSTSALRQTWIYRFSTTGSGLSLVKGGVIPDSAAVGLRTSMAVSPDGVKLALTVATPARGGSGPRSMDGIVVVDLRTGTRTAWQGGLDMTGRTLLIPDVSWRADGRSVVFLALWCNSALASNLCADASGPTASRVAQIRAIPVTSGDGPLGRGPVLMSRTGTAPVIEHALAAPDPGELTLVVLSGRTTAAGPWPVVTVQRVTAMTGAVLSTDYRLVTGGGGQASPDIELGADPSGQHLLLTYGSRSGFVTGWVSHGTLRPLPLGRQPYIGYPITAW